MDEADKGRLMTTIDECFFWYQLIWVVPDKIHRAVKRLCVCVDDFSMIWVNAFGFLLCVDTVELMTVKASIPYKPVPLIPRGSITEQMEKEELGETGQSTFI